MNEALGDKILAALRDKPKQMARQLAFTFGCRRAEINKLFYGPLRDKVVKDEEHRWSLVSPSIPPSDSAFGDFGLMERFVEAQGFAKAGDRRYLGEDGSRIEVNSSPHFPWERYSPTGELIRRYMLIDCCLEREPVQIDAGSWDLISEKPDTHSLVLKGIDGKPIEITGRKLKAMCANGKLKLYPMGYKLVYEDDLVGI